MSYMLRAFIHHIKRTAQKAGAGWSPDCHAELEAEERALADRLNAIESRLDALEEADSVAERTALWNGGHRD